MDPVPTIRRRHLDADCYAAALAAGHSELAARVLAGRGMPPDAAQITPRLAELDHYAGLAQCERAGARIAAAIRAGETIAVCTDHDVDGVTSHAVLIEGLARVLGHPRERIQSLIGHRLQEGYGLSDGVTDRIINTDPRPDLLITADHGSSDAPRIERLNALGIEVIVSDHHQLSADGVPDAADACVTPQHPDDAYGDTAIAGCLVAWLVLAATRGELRGTGELPAEGATLPELLDYVALGTVADCVSLGSSRNNRAVVRAGLARINGDTRSCWRVLNKPSTGLTAQDLAFGIGPKINARGRLDEAMAGVRFLTAGDDASAAELLATLEEQNNERKRIEKELKGEAMEQAQAQLADGERAAVIWLANGHPGVHGIIASRVSETYGCPAVCLSPKQGQEDIVTGSGRGIDGFHVRDALQACANAAPDLFTAFGGHIGAGGLTIPFEKIAPFRELFHRAARSQLSNDDIGPVLETDGPVESASLSLEAVDALAAIEPFGRGFEAPRFDGVFTLRSSKRVGDGTHVRLVLEANDGTPVPAIWFSAVADASEEIPALVGDRVQVVFELSANEWRERTLQLQVRYLEKVQVGAEAVGAIA